jgi:predicted amidohydrolase YtcJ
VKVFFAQTIRTLDPERPRARALAIDKGKIVALGEREEVLAVAGADAESEDLGKATIVPGFVDAHHHMSVAVLYEGGVDASPHATKTLAELQTALRQRAREQEPGTWVVAAHFDPWKTEDGTLLSRDELDEACPDHPVMVVYFSFHDVIVSSRALAAIGVDDHTPDPPCGRIERDRRGRATGRLVETAIGKAEGLARQSLLAVPTRTLWERFTRYQERLFQAGITRIGDAAVPPDVEQLYRRAKAEGALRVPVVMLPVSAEGFLAPPRDRLEGAVTGEGDDLLRVGPLKLFFDGADSCSMCISVKSALGSTVGGVKRALSSWSLAPLRAMGRGKIRLARDLKLYSGLRYYPDDARALEMASGALERGFGLAVHAMGNDGLDQALRVLGRARRRFPEALLRVEHAGFLDAVLARRAADEGIPFVMQPPFVGMPTDAELPLIPGLGFVALRTALDAGVLVAASSDAPVTSFQPLYGMSCAISRRNASGSPLNPEEAIDAESVLRLYTRDAARVLGCLDVTGTLEAGKRADLVVLSLDPCGVGPAGLGDVRVKRTILGGEVVFNAD